MKKALLLILLLQITVIFSQNNDETYRFSQSINIYTYNLTAKPPTTTSENIIAQKGWLFKIDHELEGGKVIRFLKWKDKNNTKNLTIYANLVPVETLNKGENKTVYNEIVKFYYLSNIDFEKATERNINKNPKVSFVTGALTIPIKIRPSGSKLDEEGNKLRPFDFTGDVNIGLSIGIRIKISSRGFLIPSGGLNLTSISVDENTVKNNIISSKTNASSITPFIGLIGEYDNFQIALITGWDRLSGRTGENWIYQGKPWFGIGLGYSIFNTSNNNPNKNED